LSEPYWNSSAFLFGPLRKICPKIEKPQALTNIEGIIEKSQALMVARQPWDEGPGAWFLLTLAAAISNLQYPPPFTNRPVVSKMFLFPMVFGIMILKQ